MSDELCSRCGGDLSDPAASARWFTCCRACRRDYNRAYMKLWRSRQFRRRRTNWGGIDLSKWKRRVVQHEAKARGVSVETIIREWGFRT